jgi:hypothetical protein
MLTGKYTDIINPAVMALHSFTQLPMTQRHLNFKHTKQQASSKQLLY